jgi:glycosyltransferase involved in cell wall biosynthesis
LSVLAGRRQVFQVLVIAYDVLVPLGIAAVVILGGPAIAGWQHCSKASLAVPSITLLVVGLTLGVGRARFGYGTAADNLAFTLAAVAAGLAAAVAWRPACGLSLAAAWVAPIALTAVPRAIAALLRRQVVNNQDSGLAGRSAVVYPAASRTHSRTVWIVTLSRPVDEPRVRRQADALYRSGWNVVAVGYKGVAPKPEYWTLVEIPGVQRAEREVSLLVQVLHPRRVAQPLLLALARISQLAAEQYYWTEQLHRQNLDDILEAAATYGLTCDFVANHDFYTLPIAGRLAERFAVPFTTDVHEYARGQYMHRPRFRWIYRHYVHALQKRYFPRAALLTVVSRGIADLLDREYPLQRPCLVVRNVSAYEPMPFRASGKTIRVLYHGLICEARGIEEAVASLPFWRPEFELVLRGPGERDYIASLQRLARRHGVEARIRFEPAVPLTELIGVANRCDIGFFASASYSPQKRFTSPNKLFEYIMAGLAVCVSDLPEMRSVVIEHGVGRLFASLAPQAIAEAINGFTRPTVDQHKRKSLAAAKVLCWEEERRLLMTAYDKIAVKHLPA